VTDRVRPRQMARRRKAQFAWGRVRSKWRRGTQQMRRLPRASGVPSMPLSFSWKGFEVAVGSAGAGINRRRQMLITRRGERQDDVAHGGPIRRAPSQAVHPGVELDAKGVARAKASILAGQLPRPSSTIGVIAGGRGNQGLCRPAIMTAKNADLRAGAEGFADGHPTLPRRQPRKTCVRQSSPAFWRLFLAASARKPSAFTTASGLRGAGRGGRQSSIAQFGQAYGAVRAGSMERFAGGHRGKMLRVGGGEGQGGDGVRGACRWGAPEKIHPKFGV